MNKFLLGTVAAFTLSACGATTGGVASTMLGVNNQSARTEAIQLNLTPAKLENAAAITSGAMTVPMVKSDGKTKIMSYQPKIALVGYNVGAYTTAKATGKANGDLLGYSQGSRTTINFVSVGITPELVQRVATAAHDDLVAKLTTAGFDVVPASEVVATPSAAKLKFDAPTYETTLTTDLGKKSVLVAGPKGVGTQKHIGIGKASFGGNAIVKPSKELSAVMVMPNLVLDFAALKTSGGALTSKSKAWGTVRFAIDTQSAMNIQASKGRFVDGWLNYGIKKPVIAEGQFAELNEVDTRSNKLEQGLGLALGMATGSKKTKEMGVAVDPVRYEALAMNAAAGWNDAFVAELVKARAN